MQDQKKRIISILEERGPSSIAQIVKALNLFDVNVLDLLSDLIKEKKIKASNLKINNSFLYFLPLQESKLENFVNYLSDIEKKAFTILRENRLIEDDKQGPEIRNAMRQIKDFAIPIHHRGKTLWKYYLLPDQKVMEALDKVVIGEKVVGQKIWEDINKGKTSVSEIGKKIWDDIEKENKLRETIIEKQVGIKSDGVEVSVEVRPEKIKKKTKKQIEKEKLDAFLGEVKVYLRKNNIELVKLDEFNKNQIVGIVRANTDPEKKRLLIVYNKKKLTMNELMRIYKKTSDKNMQYYVLLKSGITKKLQETIDACKNLTKVDLF